MPVAVQARRIAPPVLRVYLARRAAELSALALAACGVALLIALASYDPRDPSLNTATARHATNLAGLPGAAAADLLLQGFGIAGVLAGVALLAWAWRVAAHRGIGNPALRVVALLAALPTLGAVLAAIPGAGGKPILWPTPAG